MIQDWDDSRSQRSAFVQGSPYHSALIPGTRAACDPMIVEKAAGVTCKVDKIRSAWVAGDRIGALRIAARFFDRSSATKTFKRGMAAHNHPGFYRQLGRIPEQIVADALTALETRFDL